MSAVSDVRLRPLTAEDGDAVFTMMRDPVAVRMAAFTSLDPDDRAAFDLWFQRFVDGAGVRSFAVEQGGRLVGTAAVYNLPDAPEVTYWIHRAEWGRGIASAAVGLLLQAVPERPLLGGAAADNAASLAVLRRHGFREIGRSSAYAQGRRREIEEVRLRLDA